MRHLLPPSWRLRGLPAGRSCDLDPGQVLAVAGAALVAALGLELEDAQLGAALVGEDLRRDLDTGEALGVEDRIVGAVEQRLERHGRAFGRGQAFDEQVLTLLDAVLLAT